MSVSNTQTPSHLRIVTDNQPTDADIRPYAERFLSENPELGRLTADLLLANPEIRDLLVGQWWENQRKQAQAEEVATQIEMENAFKILKAQARKPDAPKVVEPVYPQHVLDAVAARRQELDNYLLSEAFESPAGAEIMLRWLLSCLKPVRGVQRDMRDGRLQLTDASQKQVNDHASAIQTIVNKVKGVIKAWGYEPEKDHIPVDNVLRDRISGQMHRDKRFAFAAQNLDNLIETPEQEQARIEAKSLEGERIMKEKNNRNEMRSWLMKTNPTLDSDSAGRLATIVAKKFPGDDMKQSFRAAAIARQKLALQHPDHPDHSRVVVYFLNAAGMTQEELDQIVKPAPKKLVKEAPQVKELSQSAKPNKKDRKKDPHR